MHYKNVKMKQYAVLKGGGFALSTMTNITHFSENYQNCTKCETY